jgi:hypothetical protein
MVPGLAQRRAPKRPAPMVVCTWRRSATLLAAPQAGQVPKLGCLRELARSGQAVVPGREAGNHHWWRRGDSTSTAFAAGWTMPSSRRSRERVDAERVIPLMQRNQCDPSARPGFRRRRVYESLQGRPEVGLLPTPRRCHAAFPKKDAVRFHRCELRFQSTLAG